MGFKQSTDGVLILVFFFFERSWYGVDFGVWGNMAVGYLVLGSRDLGALDMVLDGHGFSADLMKTTELGFTFPHDSNVNRVCVCDFFFFDGH